MLFEWHIVSHTLKGTQGTQRYHRYMYVPLSTTTLAVHEVSSGPRAKVVSIVEVLQIDISDVHVVKGNYVACMYDKKVWYGTVNDISEEFGDLLIRFMHPSMHKFVFPESDDTCWIEESDILCTIDSPSLTSSRGCTFHMDH